MLPSQRAISRDRARHGARRTVIMFRCPRCRAEHDSQPYLAGKTLRGERCRTPGCPKCSYLGYLDRVRVRD